MNVRIQYNMNFAAGIHYRDEMRMNNYNLRLWMTTNDTDSESQNVAFERIKYFVYHILDSTIMINSEHQEECQRYALAGLRITTMPGEPVDQLIGLMLYHKLNAIMEGHIIVDETEISSVMGEHITYLHCDQENVTDLKYWPDWWSTSDLVHWDAGALGSDRVLALPQANHWRELDLAWPETIEEPVETGNTIVFADFKKSDDTN
jgi:hypothetical protein